MAKKPFAFHVVTADWGTQFPDGDYTVGRGADPRAADDRIARPAREADRSDDTTDSVNDVDEDVDEPHAKAVR